MNGPEGQQLARKICLAVGIACVAIYGPAPGVKGTTFDLWVLNRWVFNFCIRSPRWCVIMHQVWLKQTVWLIHSVMHEICNAQSFLQGFKTLQRTQQNFALKHNFGVNFSDAAVTLKEKQTLSYKVWKSSLKQSPRKSKCSSLLNCTHIM